MKFVLAVLLLPLGALGAPFLVADVPSPDADTCVFTSTGGATITAPVLTDATLGVSVNGNRVCKIDLVSSPVGTNNVKLRLRNTANAPLWGDSADVPFSFARPASTAGPSALRLAP